MFPIDEGRIYEHISDGERFELVCRARPENPADGTDIVYILRHLTHRGKYWIFKPEKFPEDFRPTADWVSK